MRRHKRLASITTFLMIALLLAQQLPLQHGSVQQRGRCVDGICYCDKELCACEHCDHDRSDHREREGVSILPCGTSAHVPMVVLSVDHAYPSVTSLPLPGLLLIDGPFADRTEAAVLLPSDIFHPPRLLRSGTSCA